MPWYTELKEDIPYTIDTGDMLLPKWKYIAKKYGKFVNVYPYDDHYFITITPELAKTIFTKPYWENV